jgi:hypothetical protein
LAKKFQTRIHSTGKYYGIDMTVPTVPWCALHRRAAFPGSSSSSLPILLLGGQSQIKTIHNIPLKRSQLIIKNFTMISIFYSQFLTYAIWYCSSTQSKKIQIFPALFKFQYKKPKGYQNVFKEPKKFDSPQTPKENHNADVYITVYKK